MPWEQTSAMDQRVKFIADWLGGDYLKSNCVRPMGLAARPLTNGSSATNKVV